VPGDAPSALLALQRELFAALRTPLFGENRARNALPPGAAEPPPWFCATAAAHLTPSAALREHERLTLYQRQYWFRLLDSLADDFPGLVLLLGAPRFAALAEAYLRDQPPGRDDLGRLGAGLAAYLASGRHPVPSAVFAEELARLETAWIDAFGAAELPCPTPERLASAALTLQPHVALLALRTPADALWSRALQGQPRGRVRPPSASPARFVAVVRRDAARDVVRLHPAAHALLAALREHGSLEAALEAATPLLPARRGAKLVEAWFRQWTAERWLAVREP
jgi:hypothetical protein